MDTLLSQKYIIWDYVWHMYDALGDSLFRSSNQLELLVGGEGLRNALKQGLTVQEYRSSYTHDIHAFLEIRKKYLIYPEE
jgi:uncharacterized protein YbbC (DUF1343 family)